jgi:hypothetical protein
MFGTFLSMCFAYAILDVLMMEADDCMISMQRWLVVSYINVALFRAMQKVGQRCSEDGENFIFSFRQKSKVAAFVICVTWLVLVPFFAVWTVLGTLSFQKLFLDSPDCLVQGGVYPQLVVFWQLLSYVWVSVYTVYFCIACAIEYRLRVIERNLRLVESEDSLARWGRRTMDTDTSAILRPCRGLDPASIRTLPLAKIKDEDDVVGVHCPICLSDFQVDDEVRTLPTCFHIFHMSCIDIWLVGRAECPMCKGSVH